MSTGNSCLTQVGKERAGLLLQTAECGGLRLGSKTPHRGFWELKCLQLLERKREGRALQQGCGLSKGAAGRRVMLSSLG